jgi:hypothetical protein
MIMASSSPAVTCTLNLFLEIMQSLEKQLQQIDLTLEENGGRIGVMDEHLKNVQQEITYTESRVSTTLDSSIVGSPQIMSAA